MTQHCHHPHSQDHNGHHHYPCLSDSVPAPLLPSFPPPGSTPERPVGWEKAEREHVLFLFVSSLPLLFLPLLLCIPAPSTQLLASHIWAWHCQGRIVITSPLQGAPLHPWTEKVFPRELDQRAPRREKEKGAREEEREHCKFWKSRILSTKVVGQQELRSKNPWRLIDSEERDNHVCPDEEILKCSPGHSGIPLCPWSLDSQSAPHSSFQPVLLGTHSDPLLCLMSFGRGPAPPQDSLRREFLSWLRLSP